MYPQNYDHTYFKVYIGKKDYLYVSYLLPKGKVVQTPKLQVF